MDEIKVVPYIPDEDYDNPAMVVDDDISCQPTWERMRSWSLTIEHRV